MLQITKIFLDLMGAKTVNADRREFDPFSRKNRDQK